MSLIDPRRVSHPETGIYVRATTIEGSWVSADIAHLDRASLDAWLRERGRMSDAEVGVVMALLGHEGSDRVKAED